MKTRHRVVGTLAAFSLLLLIGLALSLFTGCRTTSAESSGLAPSASSETSTPAADPSPVIDDTPRPAIGGQTVYVTKSGKKYHVVGCSSLSKSRTSLNLAEAKRQKYTPCKRCNPPR